MNDDVGDDGRSAPPKLVLSLPDLIMIYQPVMTNSEIVMVRSGQR